MYKFKLIDDRVTAKKYMLNGVKQWAVQYPTDAEHAILVELQNSKQAFISGKMRFKSVERNLAKILFETEHSFFVMGYHYNDADLYKTEDIEEDSELYIKVEAHLTEVSKSKHLGNGYFLEKDVIKDKDFKDQKANIIIEDRSEIPFMVAAEKALVTNFGRTKNFEKGFNHEQNSVFNKRVSEFEKNIKLKKPKNLPEILKTLEEGKALQYESPEEGVKLIKKAFAMGNYHPETRHLGETNSEEHSHTPQFKAVQTNLSKLEPVIDEMKDALSEDEAYYVEAESQQFVDEVKSAIVKFEALLELKDEPKNSYAFKEINSNKWNLKNEINTFYEYFKELKANKPNTVEDSIYNMKQWKEDEMFSAIKDQKITRLVYNAMTKDSKANHGSYKLADGAVATNKNGRKLYRAFELNDSGCYYRGLKTSDSEEADLIGYSVYLPKDNRMVEENKKHSYNNEMYALLDALKACRKEMEDNKTAKDELVIMLWVNAQKDKMLSFEEAEDRVRELR